MSIFRPIALSSINTATNSKQNIPISSTPNTLKYRAEGKLVLRVYNPGTIDIGLDFGFGGGSINSLMVVSAGSVELFSCPEGDWDNIGYISAGANQDFHFTWGTTVGSSL